MPATEATFMKCPEPAARKIGKAAAMPWSTPLMLTSIIRSHSSTFSSSNRERHKAGIADKDVHPTEFLLRPFDKGGEVRALGDVNRHRFGFAALPRKFSSQRLKFVVPAGPKHHRGPTTNKILCRRLTDPTPRHRDCTKLPLDSRHQPSSSNTEINIERPGARPCGQRGTLLLSSSCSRSLSDRPVTIAGNLARRKLQRLTRSPSPPFVHVLVP